jgi:hypothetical protein
MAENNRQSILEIGGHPCGKLSAARRKIFASPS